MTFLAFLLAIRLINGTLLFVYFEGAGGWGGGRVTVAWNVLCRSTSIRENCTAVHPVFEWIALTDNERLIMLCLSCRATDVVYDVAVAAAGGWPTNMYIMFNDG